MDKNNFIVGILNLNSKTIHGLSKKNIPKRKFIPYDRSYPIFLITTRLKFQSSNIFAVIKADNINLEINQKYANGTLIRVIGNVGDYKSETEYLKLAYGIKWKKWKRFNMSDYEEDLTPVRKDLVDLKTITIDPEGCNDMDDAIHFKKLTDKKVEIGVHIADVSSYIKENSTIDEEIKKRVESVYLSMEQNNMLPDIFANNICSLKEGEIRRVFSIIFTINKKGEIINYEIVKAKIINKYKFTYKQAENIIKNKINNPFKDYLENLYHYGKILYDKQIKKMANNSHSYDIHKMIEIFMIMANKTVGKYLIERIPKHALIRIHKESERIRITDKRYPDQVLDIFNNIRMEKAEYQIGEGDETRHYGLGENFYTHFTSPIRRYADIIVHRQLFSLIKNKNAQIIDSKYCDYMNKLHSNIKKAEKDSYRLDIIYDIYNNEKPIIETIGYIISIIDDNILTVFVPKLKIDVECKIFSNKIKKIINYETSDNYINFYFKDEHIKINILDEVEIKIIVTIKESRIRKKLLVELTKPNISELIQKN